MKVKVDYVADVHPKDLAKHLIDAGPRDFANFWFGMYEYVKEKNIDLRPYAEYMADPQGGARLNPFNELNSLIEAEKYKQSLAKKRW
jgi:hypothetical protein